MSAQPSNPMPSPDPLAAKYLIARPLDQIPANRTILGNWILAEFGTPKSKWANENLIVAPTHNECTIARGAIDQATLDPARRILGYLFEKFRTPNSDAFDTWFESRFSAGPFRPWPIGGYCVQSLLYKESQPDAARAIAKAVYVWPPGPRENPDRNPKSVAKTNFVVDVEHHSALRELTRNIFQLVIVPAPTAIECAKVTSQGRNADRVPGGLGGGSGGKVCETPQIRLDGHIL